MKYEKPIIEEKSEELESVNAAEKSTEADIQEAEEEPIFSEKKIRDGLDFSTLLGKGFDNEYFADKTATFPAAEIYDGWNRFLKTEDGGKLYGKTIKHNPLTSIIKKLTGIGNGPLTFPVFVKAIQAYYERENIPSGHVTPERIEKFYEYMSDLI